MTETHFVPAPQDVPSNATRLQAVQPAGLDRFRWYGLWGSLSLLIDMVLTRLRFSSARMVRRPTYVRGRRWMQIGPGLTTGPGVRLDALPMPGNTGTLLTLGRDVQLNDYVHIAAACGIHIGDRVLLASKVFITDHNHGNYKAPGPQSDPRVPPVDRPLSLAPVVLEDDVWVGEFVAILPGVTLGRGSIVGSMSVVTRDVPPYCIAVGSPARVVKRYDFDTQQWEPV